MKSGLLRRVLNMMPGGVAVAKAIDKGAIRQAAECLAADMALLHGGAWIAQIDHEAGLILIRPQRRPGASA